ncbi:MAG: RNHCP domain-containing protein [bacterium]
MVKHLQKTVEDFVCGNCGAEVKGDGYTNHCPKCLWSKPVDVHPGDRQAACHGLMKPISVELKNGEFIIIHRCQACNLVRKNKTSSADDFGQVIKLSSSN